MKRRLTKTGAVRQLIKTRLQMSSVLDIGTQRESKKLLENLHHIPNLLLDPAFDHNDDINTLCLGIITGETRSSFPTA